MKNVFEDIYEIFIPDNIPWNRCFPHFRLIDFLSEQDIQPCPMIDLGCGLGTDAIYFAKKGFKVTAVDISQTAIYQARKKSLENGVKIDFWVSSALHLPLPDNTFDLAFDWRTSHCLSPKDWHTYVSEVSRVLIDGGHLLLTAFYLSGFEREDQKILTRPLERYPLDENKVKEIFGNNFELLTYKIFELDAATRYWAGMYFLKKKISKKDPDTNPANHFHKAPRIRKS